MADDPNAQPSAAAPTDSRERFKQAVASKQSDGVDAEGELWRGSYSHLAMIGTWIGGVVTTLPAVIIGLLASLPGAGWLMLLAIIAVLWLALVALYAYRRFSVHYTLTDQRLITETGLLWRTVDRVELIDVDDVTYRQGPVERLFTVGSIVVSSSDRTCPELSLPGIENVREVADLIDDARRKERRSRGLHIEAV